MIGKMLITVETRCWRSGISLHYYLKFSIMSHLKRNIHEANVSQPNNDWKNSHTLFILWKMNVLIMKFFKYFCPALICTFLFPIQPASSH